MVLGVIGGYFLWRRWRDIDPPITGTLTVGIPVSARPEEGVASKFDEAVSGFMRDMVMVLGAKMGRAVVVKELLSSEVEIALTSKRVDVALLDGNAAIARAASLEYIPCHTTMLTSLALVFWDKMPHHMMTIQDFAYYPYNSTVVLRNSLEERYISMFDSVQVKCVDTLTQLVVDLKVGTVRAGLVRLEQARVLRQEYSNIKVLPVSLNKRCVVQGEKVVVARENADLVTQVSKKMATLARTKSLDELHHKWFGC